MIRRTLTFFGTAVAAIVLALGVTDRQSRSALVIVGGGGSPPASPDAMTFDQLVADLGTAVVREINFSTALEQDAIDRLRMTEDDQSPGWDRAGIETTIKRPGALASLRQTMKETDGEADDADWAFDFGQDLLDQTHNPPVNSNATVPASIPDPAPMFGIQSGDPAEDLGNVMVVYWRQYWPQASLDIVFGPTGTGQRGGWKVVNLGRGNFYDSLGNAVYQSSSQITEIVMNNIDLAMMPAWYNSNEGSTTIADGINTSAQDYTLSNGNQVKGWSGDESYQNLTSNGDPELSTDTPTRASLRTWNGGCSDPTFGCNLEGFQTTHSNFPAEYAHFARFKPDQWMTFIVRITFGTDTGSLWQDSRFEFWVGYEGEAAVKVHDRTHNLKKETLTADNRVGVSRIIFTPFHTDMLSNPGRGDYNTYIGDIIIAKTLPKDPATGNPPADPSIPDYVPDVALNVYTASTVANGNDSLIDAMPAEWKTTGPTEATSGTVGQDGRAIVNPWSGGTYDYDDRQYYFTGGGHGDSANNGIYRYDFTGTTMPAGWVLEDISAVSSTLVDTNSYGDGRATSVHSYTGLVFKAPDWLYRFAGSPFGAGSCSTSWMRYNVTTKAYDFNVDGTITNVPWCGHAAFYDDVADKFVDWNIGSGAYSVFDVASDTIVTKDGSITTLSAGSGSVTMAYDPTRNKALALGELAGDVYELTWTAASNSLSVAQVTPLGDTADITTAYAPAVVYDPDRDVYWAMDISSETPANQDFLWEIDPATHTFTKHTLVSNPIDKTHGTELDKQPRGGYGKLIVLKGWDALAMFNKVGGPMYVIRKP